MTSSKKEIKFLEKKIAKNPNSPLFARLADLHLEQGDVDKAIEICEEGLQEHPYYVTGHIVLSKCYAALGMSDQAKSELKRILLFDPQCIVATKAMGDMMKEEGWENLYRESYRRLSMLDPLEESVMQMVEEFGPESKLPQEKEPLSDVIETDKEIPSEQSSSLEAEVSETASDEVVEEIVEPVMNAETPSDMAQSAEIGMENQTEVALPEEIISSEQPFEASLESGKEELFTISPFEGKSFEEQPITFAQPESPHLSSETSAPSTEQLSESEPFSQEGAEVEPEKQMIEMDLPIGSEDFKKTDEVEEVIPESTTNLQPEEDSEGIKELGVETTSVLESDNRGILEESGTASQSWGAWETLEKEPAETGEPQDEQPGTDKIVLETVQESGTQSPEITEESELPFEEGLKEEKFIELSESPEEMKDQISLEKTKELDWLLNEGDEVPRIVEENAETPAVPTIEKESGKGMGLETIPAEDFGKEEPVSDFKEMSFVPEEDTVLSSDEKDTGEIEEILPEIEAPELPSLEEKDESVSEELFLPKDIPKGETPDENLSISEEALLTVSDQEFFDTMEKDPELSGPPQGELLSLIDEVIGGKDETESAVSPDQSGELEDLSDNEIIDFRLDTPRRKDEISAGENQENVQPISDSSDKKERNLRDRTGLKTGMERDSRTPKEFSLKEHDERLQREDDLKTGIDRELRATGEEMGEKEIEDSEEKKRESLETPVLDLRDLDEIVQESVNKKLRDNSVRTGMRKFDSREVTDNEKKLEREHPDKLEEKEEEFTLSPELPEKDSSREEEMDLESQEGDELLLGKRELSRRTPEELKTGRVPEGEEELEIEDEESSELSIREREDKSGSGLDELVTLTLGEIYLSKNQLDKAIKVFKQLKEIYPDNKKISTKLRRAQRLKRNAQKEQKNTNESTDPETSQEWRITGD